MGLRLSQPINTAAHSAKPAPLWLGRVEGAERVSLLPALMPARSPNIARLDLNRSLDLNIEVIAPSRPAHGQRLAMPQRRCNAGLHICHGAPWGLGGSLEPDNQQATRTDGQAGFDPYKDLDDTSSRSRGKRYADP